MVGLSLLMRRASSFLLLADSQASFEIEGERVTRNRIENWGKIINQKKIINDLECNLNFA